MDYLLETVLKDTASSKELRISLLSREMRPLRAAFDACRADELAAADQLSKPRHSLLYPAYTRLLDALGACG
jgi:hypothetical protein